MLKLQVSWEGIKKILRYLFVLLLLVGIGYLGYLGYYFATNAPQKVRVTNLTGSSATISWYTNRPDKGIVVFKDKNSFLPILPIIGSKIGNDDRDVANAQAELVNKLTKQAAKDINADYAVTLDSKKLTDLKVTKEGKYYVHHVTINNLNEEKNYFFRVGDGMFWWNVNPNNQTHKEFEAPTVVSFEFKTLKEVTEVKVPDSAFGKILAVGRNKDGYIISNPTQDALIFAKVEGTKSNPESAYLSSVVNSDGGWVIEKTGFRTQSGEIYKQLEKGVSTLNLFTQFENAAPEQSYVAISGVTDSPVQNIYGNSDSEIKLQGSLLDKLKFSFVQEDILKPLKFSFSSFAAMTEDSGGGGGGTSSGSTTKGNTKDPKCSYTDVNGKAITINVSIAECIALKKAVTDALAASAKGPCSFVDTKGLTVNIPTPMTKAECDAQKKTVIDAQNATSGSQSSQIPLKNRTPKNQADCDLMGKPVVDGGLGWGPSNWDAKIGACVKIKDSQGRSLDYSNCTGRYANTCEVNPTSGNSTTCYCQLPGDKGYLPLRGVDCRPAECASNRNKDLVCTAGNCISRTKADPTDPSKLILCGNDYTTPGCAGKATDCPAGTVFNSTGNNCVLPGSVTNGGGSSTPSEGGNTSTGSGTYACTYYDSSCNVQNKNVKDDVACFALQKNDANCFGKDTRYTLCPINEGGKWQFKVMLVSNCEHFDASTHYTGIAQTNGGDPVVSCTYFDTVTKSNNTVEAPTSMCEQLKKNGNNPPLPSTNYSPSSAANSSVADDASLITCSYYEIRLQMTTTAKMTRAECASKPEGKYSETDSKRCLSLEGKVWNGSECLCDTRWYKPGSGNSTCVLRTDLGGYEDYKPVQHANTGGPIPIQQPQNIMITNNGDLQLNAASGTTLPSLTNTYPIINNSNQSFKENCYTLIKENKIDSSLLTLNNVSAEDIKNALQNVAVNPNQVGQTLQFTVEECVKDLTQPNIPSTINLVSKVNAQDSVDIVQSGNYFAIFPESGLYDIQIGDNKFTSIYVDANNKYSFYIERNNKDGYQLPSNPKKVQDNEDLLLPLKGAVVSLYDKSSVHELKLSRGINLVSFNYLLSKSDKTVLTAKDVMKMFNASRENVTRISMFDGGKWNSGIAYNSASEKVIGNDFVIEPGVGYLFVAKADSVTELPGYNLSQSVPVALSSGWNLIGVNGYDKTFTSSSLIDSVNGLTGLKSNNVTWWPTSKGRYESFQKSEGVEYGFDFPILNDMGYFVRISEFNPADSNTKSIIWNPGGDLNGQPGSEK